MDKRLTSRDKEIPLPNPDNALFWARVHEKLARYEDAEAEGRLIVLPCKVGDTLWQRGAAKGTIGSFEAPDVHWIIEHTKEFGKTVFLSREEAEAALAKEG